MKLAAALLLGFATVAWADPADDLRACQAKTQEVDLKSQDTERVRNFYAVQAAALQTTLESMTRQMEALRMELMRARAPKLEEKK